MANHYRTPEEIERDLERERAGLTATLADIGNRLSLDELAHSVGDQAKDYAADLTHTAQRIVRENPLGVALTGLGLAWLLFGSTARSRIGDMRSGTFSSERSNPRSPYGANHMSHYGTTTTRRTGYEPYARTDDETGHWADDRHWQDTDFELASDDTDPSPTFLDRIWSAVGSAKDKAGEISDSIRAGVHDASDAVSDTGRRGASGMRYRARMTRDASRRMSERLSAGTEHLSEGARARVIAARERAVAARREAMVIARARGRDAARGFDAYPLAGGAVALAVGAALGAILPRTRFEDHYFGERSDALYSRAEQILREERARAEQVARAAMDEAGRVAGEMRADFEDSVRAARDDAVSGVDRVAEQARAAANDSHPGGASTDRTGGQSEQSASGTGGMADRPATSPSEKQPGTKAH